MKKIVWLWRTEVYLIMQEKKFCIVQKEDKQHMLNYKQRQLIWFHLSVQKNRFFRKVKIIKLKKKNKSFLLGEQFHNKLLQQMMKLYPAS